jgi:hypothetical protein
VRTHNAAQKRSSLSVHARDQAVVVVVHARDTPRSPGCRPTVQLMAGCARRRLYAARRQGGRVALATGDLANSEESRPPERLTEDRALVWRSLLGIALVCAAAVVLYLCYAGT